MSRPTPLSDDEKQMIGRRARRGGRFGRKAGRRTARRRGARLTPEDLVSGRAARRLERPERPSGTPTAYLDLVDYLITRGYCRTRREAHGHLFGGRVNVNQKVWAYPEIAKHQLTYDDYGRPRIMVEGVEDPRPIR